MLFIGNFSMRSIISHSMSQRKINVHLCINYYKNKDQDTLTMEMKDEYEKHQSRKIKAREEKKKDKEMAIFNQNFLSGRLISKQYCRLRVVWSVNCII